MEELVRVIQGLRFSRPSITLEQLLALDSPSAEFEAHVPADSGKDYWVYTVNGKLLEGEAMVVRASKFMPQTAETLAQEGLKDTIRAARNYDHNTGLQAEVIVRGAHEQH